jgi:hypothetical protein
MFQIVERVRTFAISNARAARQDVSGWHIGPMLKLLGIGTLAGFCLFMTIGMFCALLVGLLWKMGVPEERLQGNALAACFLPGALTAAWSTICIAIGVDCALRNRHSRVELNACYAEYRKSFVGVYAILFFPITWILKRSWRRGSTTLAVV